MVEVARAPLGLAGELITVPDEEVGSVDESIQIGVTRPDGMRKITSHGSIAKPFRLIGVVDLAVAVQVELRGVRTGYDLANQRVDVLAIESVVVVEVAVCGWRGQFEGNDEISRIAAAVVGDSDKRSVASCCSRTKRNAFQVLPNGGATAPDQSNVLETGTYGLASSPLSNAAPLTSVAPAKSIW